MLAATLSLCPDKSATETWTGLPIKLDMSKSDTVTRKCRTPNPSELCQSHSRQNTCRCHFYAQTPYSLALDTPGCRSADWTGAGFQHSPFFVYLCSSLLRLLFLVLSVPPSGSPTLLPFLACCSPPTLLLPGCFWSADWTGCPLPTLYTAPFSSVIEPVRDHHTQYL